MTVVDNRVALLTGAAGGLGAAIATRLASAGIAVAMCDANPEVEDGARALQSQGQRAISIVYDVTDPQAAAAAHERARSELGEVTIVITAAAIVDQVKRSWQFTPQMWQRELDVNLSGTFYAIAPALATLKDRPGRVVVVSSVGALTGLAGQVAYATTKAGLLGLVKSLALELAGSGTTVNAVLPGAIATPKFTAMPDRVQERMRSAIPLARFADVHEVADLVVYLLSGPASYLTGAELVVDGGLSWATSLWDRVDLSADDSP